MARPLAETRPGRTMLGLWRFLWRGFPSQAGRALTLLAAATVTQGVSLALLVPLLGLVGVGSPDGAVGATVARAFSTLGLPVDLVSVLAVFVVLNLAAIALAVAQERAAARLHLDAVERVRRTTLEALDAASWQRLAALDRPRVAYALTLEAERTGVAVQNLLLLVAQAGVLVVVLGWAMSVQPVLTLAVAAAAGVLLASQRRRTRASQEAGHRLGKSMHRMLGSTQAWLQGLKTLRFLPAPPVATQEVRDLQRLAVRERSMSRGAFEAGGVVLLAVTVGVATSWLQLEAAALLFLLYLYARAIPASSRALVHLHAVRQGLPAFGAWQELVRDLETDREEGGTEPPELRSELELRQVTVQHVGGAEVGPVDLHVPAGRVTALKGPSGVGKTTLLDVAAGLLAPASGQVLLDGRALQDRRAWRHGVAYVPQEPFLLDATVADNLEWMAPDADPEERLGVLRDLAPDVLPDAPVGERGSRLSGGQRRRVAIAMALLRRPRLLVVDEPTSELDPESAQRVLEAIAALRGTTVLVATHGDVPAGARVVEWPGSPLNAEAA